MVRPKPRADGSRVSHLEGDQEEEDEQTQVGHIAEDGHGLSGEDGCGRSVAMAQLRMCSPRDILSLNPGIRIITVGPSRMPPMTSAMTRGWFSSRRGSAAVGQPNATFLRLSAMPLTMQQLAKDDDDDGLWHWLLLLAHWQAGRLAGPEHGSRPGRDPGRIFGLLRNETCGPGTE